MKAISVLKTYVLIPPMLIPIRVNLSFFIHRMPQLVVTLMEQTLLLQLVKRNVPAIKILNFIILMMENIVVYLAVFRSFPVSVMTLQS